MPRRRQQPSQQEQTEAAIRRAGSIGALERLAGIGGAPEERTAFWQTFRELPGAQALDTGVAALKQRIRAQAEPTAKSSRTKRERHAWRAAT